MPYRAIAEARGDEKLREALLELERARARERQARDEASALLEAMEAMTRAPSPSAAIAALLERVAGAFGAEAAAILRAAPGNAMVVAHATDPSLVGARWSEVAQRASRPRRLIEIDHDALAAPEALRAYRSLMSTPLMLGADGAAAVACFSRDRAGFTGAQLQFLGRLGGLATQALAAHALWERHALLAGVIEGSANAVAIFDAVDPHHACVYVNPAFEQLTGHDGAGVLGAPWEALNRDWRLEEDEATRVAIRETIAAHRSGSFEVRNRRRDGSGYWARLFLFPVESQDGVVRQFVATQTDITERRKAQAERDAARAQLDSALSSTSQGFAVLGPGGEVAYANAAFADFFPVAGGWRAGEDFAALWRARSVAAGGDPATAKADARRFRDWVFSGDAAREEALPEGRTALIATMRTRDHGAVLTVADVTRMKRAEAQLAERAAAIDAAQDGIALTDADGAFRYMNPSHLAMFGFDDPAEIVGMPWEALYAPEAAERIRREAFPELGRSGGWRGESVGRHRSGALVEQEVSLTRLADGGLVCVTRDISERRRGERERLRLREEVQTAHRREAVGQIAAGVAHDFNNLLAAIAGSAALADATLDEAGDGSLAQVRRHLDRIARAAESGADLMRRLLGLGAREKRRIPCDLAEPLRNVADLVTAGVGVRVTVATDLPATPLVATADPGDILHLALNLALNARDALRAEGGHITLGLRRATADDLARAPLLGTLDPARRYAMISVGDDGEGVPAELGASIFMPHVSTKGDAGTGLGLAIVASVIADNDAALILTSAPGHGAVFDVFWPLDPATSAADDVPPTSADAAGVSLAGFAILVVEDSPAMLDALGALLERAGAEVGSCESPVMAVEAIEEDPSAWDLVITDLEMPELDGAALAARARAAAPATPIILCTGAPEAEIAVVRGRFDAILRKPVSETALVAAARRALARPEKGDL